MIGSNFSKIHYIHFQKKGYMIVYQVSWFTCFLSICSSCSIDIGGKLKGLGEAHPMKTFSVDRKNYFKRQSFIF